MSLDPKVRSLIDGEMILATDASWVGVGVNATIFITEEGFERFACHAEVINVQDNRLVQIRPNFELGTPEHQAFWQKIAPLDRGRIIIKPGSRI